MIAPMERCCKRRHANKPVGGRAANHPGSGPAHGRGETRGCCGMLLAHRPAAGDAPRPLRCKGVSPRPSRICERFEIRKLFGIPATILRREALISYVSSVTGSLVRIIMPPFFRPSPAPLPCNKGLLRWPGPFGSGFLSPQPPGIVGIGPIAGRLTGPTRVGPFLFSNDFLHTDSARSREASPGVAGRRSKPQTFRRCCLSAAKYRPRPAWGPACRGCHPGHRQQRHRHPCG
jgi:hypothetical protein